MAEKIQLWERQPGETTKQFEAFAIYRDMGMDRSLSKVARELSKSKQLLTRWSSANNWVDRCEAYDVEQDRLLRAQQQKDIKNMRKRHAKIAEAMLIKAANALKAIPDEEVKAGDISRMVDIASKLERISRGDVGDVVEQRDGGESVDAVKIYIPDNNRGRDKEDFDDLEV